MIKWAYNIDNILNIKQEAYYLSVCLCDLSVSQDSNIIVYLLAGS